MCVAHGWSGQEDLYYGISVYGASNATCCYRLCTVPLTWLKSHHEFTFPKKKTLGLELAPHSFSLDVVHDTDLCPATTFPANPHHTSSSRLSDLPRGMREPHVCHTVGHLPSRWAAGPCPSIHTMPLVWYESSAPFPVFLNLPSCAKQEMHSVMGSPFGAMQPAATASL